jgi:hypothetical protein
MKEDKPQINIENCTVDMSKPDETKIAIAKAVEEGMKALQSLGGNSYGIYLNNKDYDLEA